MKMKSHSDETIVTGEIEDPSEYNWTVYIDGESQQFEEWGPAFDEFIDSMRYWMGYWSEQAAEAADRNLQWTKEMIEARVDDYERWINHLESIKNRPQMIAFLGSNQKLSITPRKKNADA